MTTIVFAVVGKPEPQGSMKAFMPKGARFPIVTSDNPKLKAWRKQVAKAALALHDGDLLTGPMRVCVDFYLPRPKALRKDKPHVTRPDPDKLARSILDSLTGVLYQDDGQVVQLKVTKAYAAAGDSPCAVISVTPLAEQDVRCAVV